MEGERIQETTLPNNVLSEAFEDETVAANEVARLTKELEEERERSLRLLAEFNNYRRRMKLEFAQADQKGQRALLLAILEVMDDFDRASLHIGAASDPVAMGLRLIHERLLGLFEATGVNRFDSEGKPFDPMIHEAVTVIDSDERESGTVYAEERPGYFINGELLRPARVAVLK
jgi:molecular chaperone GrpE